jgi:hypothetical protein
MYISLFDGIEQKVLLPPHVGEEAQLGIGHCVAV